VNYLKAIKLKSIDGKTFVSGKLTLSQPIQGQYRKPGQPICLKA
jgi:hypothetical protein